MLGTLQELEELIEREGIDEVIYAPDRSSAEELAELSERCKSASVNTAITPELFELVTGELYLGYELDSLPLADLDSLPGRGWYLGFKPVFDLVVASLLLLLLAIPMALMALAIKLDSKGPVLFRQTRVGKGNRRLTFYKFRTMREGVREGVEPQDVEQYMRQVTRVGRFLRKMRLDEMPQLFNVLKGDMSLVGPRPEWDKFVEKMARQIPLFNKRHLVRPGMAGWAQVQFKHTTDVEEYKRKLRYDLYYIKHMSPSLDIKALLRTLWVVITGRGAR